MARGAERRTGCRKDEASLQKGTGSSPRPGGRVMDRSAHKPPLT